MGSSLGDKKLFFGPKHNIYAIFMILFGLLGLILLLVCQICHMNCQTDKVKIKENLFLKSVRWFDQRYYCVPFDIPFAMHLVDESYISNR